MGISRSEAGKMGAEKSKIIFALQKKQRIEKYNENKNKCTFCLKDLSYELRNNKFCNRSCSAQFNCEKKKKFSNCLYCGKVPSGKRRAKQKYCSISCQHKLLKEQKVDKLFNGEELEIGQAGIRKLLIHKYGAKCMECGWDKINQYSNKCPIELEHIDGNHNNNNVENLRLLCPNCHSLTSTYKGLNRGKGRHKRKIRYHDNKSY